jgi:hypothetical protein
MPVNVLPAKSFVIVRMHSEQLERHQIRGDDPYKVRSSLIALTVRWDVGIARVALAVILIYFRVLRVENRNTI